MLKIKIFTLYPDMFPGPLDHGLFKKAKKKNIWDIKIIDIRIYAKDKHRTVMTIPLAVATAC